MWCTKVAEKLIAPDDQTCAVQEGSKELVKFCPIIMMQFSFQTISFSWVYQIGLNSVVSHFTRNLKMPDT